MVYAIFMLFVIAIFVLVPLGFFIYKEKQRMDLEEKTWKKEKEIFETYYKNEVARYEKLKLLYGERYDK
jgi:Na+/H+ antiporter NhaC